jgi:hypothetical protein
MKFDDNSVTNVVIRVLTCFFFISEQRNLVFEPMWFKIDLQITKTNLQTNFHDIWKLLESLQGFSIFSFYDLVSHQSLSTFEILQSINKTSILTKIDDNSVKNVTIEC